MGTQGSRLNKTAICFAVAVALGIGGSVLYNWKKDEWIVIPDAREVIRSKLRDPQSAQFRNERITKTGALCGEVNAKNGMGGYVGFRKYVSHGGGQYVEDSWVLGEKTHDQYIQHIQRRTDILKRFIDMRKEFPDLESPSADRVSDMATSELFDAEWENTCGSSA